jgi:Fe2+ transport system protein B
MKITFCKETKNRLLEIGSEKGIYIEGNILKLIEFEGDEEVEAYVKKATKLQKEKQRKRLDVTKQVQTQNKQLIIVKEEIQEANSKLEAALTNAEHSKESALKDLDILQKKTQFELVTVIVKISLAIIIGVGVFTTALYMFSIYYGKETQLIGNTWSNMFGILLTNAFSIIGTIMGVKYATGENRKSSQKYD